jgi:nucleoside-diphosphate-sugar epimerase
MKFERVIDCSWNGLPNLTDTFNLENLEIKLKLLRIFADIGVTEINSFGSCLEYGNLNGEVTEESAGREISNFGLTKLRILEALENSGIRFRWFRPFYLIGAQQHRNSLIHAAIETMSKGFDFVPREPSLMFDFISINDAIKGVVAALNNQDCLGVINLGSSQETSVNEIVNLVRDYFGFDRTEVNGISGMIANCDKLKSMTGWRLEESMPEAVNRILKTKGIG